MDKSDLKALIKQIVLKTTKSTSNTIDLNNIDSNINLESARFPLLEKFPPLKKVIIDLFTNQYELFISETQFVAPKPTSFRVILANNQFIYLTYLGKSWVAQVEGKKYYLNNLDEEERACESIARILSYGNPSETQPTEGEAPEEETPEPPSKKKKSKEPKEEPITTKPEDNEETV